MLSKLDDFILGHQLLRKEAGPVVAGVSGGLDSMCLMHSLHELGYDIVCAHYDHKIRDESTEDAEFVRAAAAELKIPFALEVGDVRAYSRDNGLSLEEAGREMRYRFLFELARNVGAQAVATGHNADDQVETVVMHFIRGAGLSGLKGMLPSTVLASFAEDIPLVRPMLTFDRAFLAAYCHESGIQYRDDISNAEMTYFRNRLRHELIPMLETYNEGFRKTVLRNALVLGRDEEFLEELTEKSWNKCVLELQQSYAKLDREALQSLHAALQARMLRKTIRHFLPGLRDIDLASIQRGIAALSSDAARREADLLGGLRILAEGDVVWIAKGWQALPRDSWPQIVSDREVTLAVPGEIALANGWFLSAEIFSGSPEAISRDDKDVFWLKPDQSEIGLQIRGRRPGERFNPAGFGGHSIKLSDFMVNEKIPKRARQAWPIVASGDQVVWVVGRRGAEQFIAEPEAGQVLLRLFRR